jgi:hypothetical protein
MFGSVVFGTFVVTAIHTHFDVRVRHVQAPEPPASDDVEARPTVPLRTFQDTIDALPTVIGAEALPGNAHGPVTLVMCTQATSSLRICCNLSVSLCRLPTAISVPFCFICLLHLANEHNLSLETQHTEGGDDKVSLGNFRILQNVA